jgi:hypothetical protein
MKMMLTNKTQMEFYNICSECKDKVYGCCELFKNHYENNMEAIIEYKFEYNNSKKSADVALIKENNIVYIFEICYKNKTRESARPEPWVEIKAEDLIRDINNGSLLDDNGILHIECIRDSICNECEEERVNEIIRMKEWCKRLEQERKEKERLDKEKEIEKKKQEAIRINREILNKIIEIQLLKEQELERKKQHEKFLERQNIINLESDKFYQEMLRQDDKCLICNINYCKCANSKIIKNTYGISQCLMCNKRKCKCVKITDYFKQKNT